MGNQQGCCPPNENHKQLPINSFNPIKYGSTIHKFQNFHNTGLSKMAKDMINQNDINIRLKQNIQDSKMNKQAQNEQNQKPLLNRNFQSVISIHSKDSMSQSQSIKRHSIFGQYSQRQIVDFEYSPVIQKLLTRQKPFYNEFSQIQRQKIKIFKINHQKDIYKGQVDKTGKMHGYGTIKKQNGSFLIGHFVDGLPQGQIFYAFSNASYYKGQILNNKAHDTKGQFHSKNFTYIGGFSRNQFDGSCFELGDNYSYQGQYIDGKKSQGCLEWQIKTEKNKSQISKQSIVINDQLPLVRNFSQINIYKYRFQGQFDQDQLFTKNGILQDPQGIYQGNFIKGKKHGKGVYSYNTKLKYEGDYVNDQKCGFGVLTNCDETIAYQGNWKNGLPNGKGFSYDLDGRKTQAQFVEGLNKNALPQSKISSVVNPESTIG